MGAVSWQNLISISSFFAELIKESIHNLLSISREEKILLAGWRFTPEISIKDI
jgi:hypothetical protein